MGRLSLFNFMSLDGYCQGRDGDIRWAHAGDEGNEYAAEMLEAGDTLVFGRRTYAMMAAFWPTPQAAQMAPRVAEGMARAKKLVFSTTLDKPGWEHTTVIAGDVAGTIAELKHAGTNMTILGSGSIVAQIVAQGLIDDYQIRVDPVVLGEGISIFKGVSKRLNLRLVSTRAFRNGSVLLRYENAG